MDYNYLLCSLCGYGGLLKASPGEVTGRPIHLKYNWICVNCKAHQESTPLDELLNVDEFFNESVSPEPEEEEFSSWSQDCLQELSFYT